MDMSYPESILIDLSLNEFKSIIKDNEYLDLIHEFIQNYDKCCKYCFNFYILSMLIKIASNIIQI